MAGKVNKGKNKGRSVNSEPVISTETESTLLDSSTTSSVAPEATKTSNGGADGDVDPSSNPPAVDGAAADKAEDGNPAQTTNKKLAEAGEVHLYPVTVKAQSGEKLELQLSPSDNVLDIRQFLLDASETCYFTCYDLILHTKDGSFHHMEDYNEVSEVADITSGGCYIEMVGALYDDRSIRCHVRRARELFSLSSLQTSLSTLLALQHENTHKKNAELAKSESAELDGLGFMEDITGTLPKFVTPGSPSKEIACVESIVFSSFNPPPTYRRLVGDLIYLDVVTLEGNTFCITGTTKGFYINCSTGSILDPKPSKVAHEASTLVGVLQKISSKFRKGFREILDQKASAHPYENVQSLLPPPNTWLRAYPVPDHKRDAARAEEALALTYGSELGVMQRDWNEELQSCREFPHKTFQERILRDRALYKVTCDFVDAATKGAIGVINRCIPPINPTDPECFHMYVYNNIFFSFAVDADLGHISKGQDLGLHINLRHGSENGRILSDSSARTSSNTSSETNDNSSPLTSAISGAPHHTVSDGSAELQLTDSEQATYASANNDLKGTKAYQEADIPGLYNLAMAIIDYRGYRVVAQSIIPGILQGDKSDSLLYGSVDNGKKICWNESFHSKVLEAAKRLHLKEHAVLDGSGNVVNLAAPVECKGIIGGDNRHYLLDLMRVTPRDANYIGPEHRFCVLRPELVASFCEAEAADKSDISSRNTGETSGESELQDGTSADARAAPLEGSQDSSGVSGDAAHEVPAAEIFFNPNVFTEFKLAGPEEEVAADEAIVKKIGSYLLDNVLPKFVQDLCSLETSPMDGQSLTDSLHTYGINIRYLGKVAGMVKHFSHLWDLCSTEIIVRSAKHILKDVLRETQDHDLGPAIAHFFNCFFGRVSSASTKGKANDLQSKTSKKAQQNKEFLHKSVKGQRRSSHGTSFKESNSAYMLLTSESLWSYIQDFTKLKYQFELEEDAKLWVRKIAVVRNLCQKVGVTIAARKYDLESTSPFQSTDILDLHPVTKHSVPLCSEARDLMGAGKARLAEGLLSEAHNFFSEAFTVLQQVTGPIHRDVANCCRYLAMILYHAGDLAGAIVHQHKELIINERCLGLDHPDTAHSYGNMALFYHGMNQTELALRHMSRTLLLLSLTSGPDHPDIASTFINVAMMYQEAGNMNAALRYLQEALKKNERLLGLEHIQTAVCYHAFALAYNCMGAYKLSVQQEKKTYDILAKHLGEDDPRTRDSENWIKTFQVREQEKQKGPAVDIASALKTIKAHPELWRAFQAAGASSRNASSSTINRSLNTAMISEAILRGKGTDERAARTTAGARKKAAAKGLRAHQNGAPVQGLPSLKQQSHTSSGISSPNAPADAHLDAENVEANNSTSNGSSAGIKDADGSSVKGQAPVGLGTTLASLDSKKRSSKSKVSS